VKIISSNHNLGDFEKHDDADPIVIEDYCWLGANSVILPGVKLGCHVIISAGGVATKSFAKDNIVIGGMPARILKTIDPYKGGLPENVTTMDEV